MEEKIFVPINQIAHGINMQNQYLYRYVYNGDIEGKTNPPSHSYHDDSAQVELNSLLKWIHTRYPNYWSKEQYEVAVAFIEKKLKCNEVS